MKLSLNRFKSLYPIIQIQKAISKQSETPKAITVRMNNQKRLKKQRNHELKLLMMMSLIKLYKKQYTTRVNYQEFITLSSEKRKEQYAFECFLSIQKTILKQLAKIKQQKQNLNPSNFLTKTQSNMNATTASLKGSMRSVYQYERESLQFQKLNHLIDKSDVNSTVRKSLEYLKILKQLCEKIKIIIFKYYKIMNKIQNIQKLDKIRQYVKIITNLFQSINSMLSFILEKDQSYDKYMISFRLLENQLSEKDTIFHHLQNLLFYFHSYNNIQKIYEKFPKLQQVAYYNIPLINKIIQAVIKLRHALGYLSKQIINVSLMFNKEMKGDGSEVNMFSKMAWKTIYQRKYLTNHFKNRLKLD